MEDTQTKYTKIRFILLIFNKNFFAKIFIILRFSSLFLLLISALSFVFIFFCNKFLTFFSKFFSSIFIFFLLDFFLFTLIRLLTLNKFMSFKTPV